LADKSGKLYPHDDLRAALEVEQWLMWQMGGLGPMAGQAGFFHHFNKGVCDYAEERYINEVARLYGVLDKRLADRDFVAGAYSIADIAIWPWIAAYEMHGQSFDPVPNLKGWFERVGARPAVKRGAEVGSELRKP
jgi:GST-like protein